MAETIFSAMNTIVQIRIEGKDDSVAVEKAKATILDCEKRFNCFSRQSEVSKLCRHIETNTEYSIGRDLYEILLIAQKISKKTNGLFDVDFENHEKHKQYHLANSNLISFESKKTKINLGAIAKGYAADKTMENIKKFNVGRAMISMGGQVTCFSRTQAWQVGLQNPNKKFGQIIGLIAMSNGSLSTSAENYRGKHIKNPQSTNWEKNIDSISVFSDSGSLADAYSTALFLADPKTRKKLAQKNNLNVIIINGEIIKISANLLNKFVLVDKKCKVEKY